MRGRGHLCSFALISGDTDQIPVKILSDVSLHKEIPVKFGNSCVSEYQTEFVLADGCGAFSN